MKRKIIAVITALLIVGVSGCAPVQNTLSQSGVNENGAVTLTGSAGTESDDSSSVEANAQATADKINSALRGASAQKWVNSSLEGSMTPESQFRKQDDFSAAVTQDWFCNTEGYYQTFMDVSDDLYERKMEILAELPNAAEKGQQELYKYYRLATDWETRNAQGMDPIKPYIQAIDDISDREELYAWICDRELNPYGIAPLMYTENTRSEKDPSMYVASLKKPTPFLEQPSLYYDLSVVESLDTKGYKEREISAILKKLGYDDKEIKDIIRDNYRFEKKMMSVKSVFYGRSTDRDTHTRKEAVEAAGKYPLDEYLTSFGISDEAPVWVDTKYLKRLNNMCRKGNLDQIKAMLKVQFLLNCYYNLDRDLFDTVTGIENEMNSAQQIDGIYTKEREENNIFFDKYLTKSYICGAFNEMYLDRFVSDEEVTRLEGLTNEIIDSYREVLSNEEWLSADGKKAAIEKLDSIVPHVIRPNSELLNYDDLNITPLEEGGSFLEAQIEIERFTKKTEAKHLYQKYDRNIWDPYNPSFSTTISNAFYAPSDNAIFILAGICCGSMYSAEMTDEQLLGKLGSIVGHELTHGFDQGGIKYDKNGIEQEWFPALDKFAFSDRVMSLQQYYNQIKPLGNTPYSGINLGAEATADMGGMKIVLNLAKKNPNFDYDTYFTSFAMMWKAKMPYAYIQHLMEIDPHPLDYLRTNCTVQQFEEFYETYDVKPGDGMYLAPDKRIAVW